MNGGMGGFGGGGMGGGGMMGGMGGGRPMFKNGMVAGTTAPTAEQQANAQAMMRQALRTGRLPINN